MNATGLALFSKIEEEVAKIIKENYPQITKNRILGHREVKEGRTCPGNYFLKEWKNTLLGFIQTL